MHEWSKSTGVRFGNRLFVSKYEVALPTKRALEEFLQAQRLELLGETATTKLHRDRDSKGMAPLKKDAKDGGAVAGRTRKDIEKQSGQPVISKENFKQLGHSN